MRWSRFIQQRINGERKTKKKFVDDSLTFIGICFDDKSIVGMLFITYPANDQVSIAV